MREPSIPSSRLPPVSLERPLALFGKTFRVELSTSLTLGPDTVLRAAIGKSLTTLLREQGRLQPLRQFSYGMLGKHKLSDTTKNTVAAAMGPIAKEVRDLLDGGPVPQALEMASDWATLAVPWGPVSRDNAIEVVVQSFIELDQFMESVSVCTKEHGQEAGEQMFASRFGNVRTVWRDLCPGLTIQGALRIESSLHVLADMERTLGTVDVHGNLVHSLVERYLQPKAKPLGHWLREVGAAVRCVNNLELGIYVENRKICHQGERPITRDTVKGWSAMKPGMLMSLEGCQSLLTVVTDETKVQQLVSRFAVARFLAFLCDFLRSCTRPDALEWSRAQSALLARYHQIVTAPR